MLNLKLLSHSHNGSTGVTINAWHCMTQNKALNEATIQGELEL